MKLTLAFACLFLALAAAPVAAGGINLSWNDCGSFGIANVTNDCTSNAGAYTLVVSFVAGAGIDSAVSQSTYIVMQTAAAAIEPWWQLKLGGCRPHSLSADFTFSPPSGCINPWGSGVVGGIAWDYDPTYPNRAILRTASAIALVDAFPMSVGTEYEICAIVIDRAKSVGPGACSGCLAPVGFVLNSVRIYQTEHDPHGDVTYMNAVNSQCASYNGGVGFCQLTPTRNRTWGSVKALYR